MPRRTVTILPFSHTPIEPSKDPVCQTCKGSLQFHQPDIDRPYRLLGVCSFCHSWTLIGIGEDCRVHVLPTESK
jgi:hypothetical protein